MKTKLILFSLLSISFLALERYFLTPQREYSNLQDIANQLEKNLINLENTINSVRWRALEPDHEIKLLLKIKNSSLKLANIKLFDPIKSGYTKYIKKMVETDDRLKSNMTAFLKDPKAGPNGYFFSRHSFYSIHKTKDKAPKIILLKWRFEFLENHSILAISDFSNGSDYLQISLTGEKNIHLKDHLSVIIHRMARESLPTEKFIYMDIKDNDLEVTVRKWPKTEFYLIKVREASILAKYYGFYMSVFSFFILFSIFLSLGSKKLTELVGPAFYLRVLPELLKKKIRISFPGSKDKHIERLRKRVFGPETKELMQDISSKDTIHSFKERLNELQKKLNSITVGSGFFQLNKNSSKKHRQRGSFENVLESLPFLCGDLQADALILLRYDQGLHCYAPFAYYGIVRGMAKNFYALPKDEIIPLNKDNETTVRCADELKQNPYFKKRFDNNKKFLNGLEFLQSLPLQGYGINGFIILFYMSPKETMDVEYNKTVWRSKVKNVIPVLKIAFRRKEIYFKNDPHSRIISEFKNITQEGTDPAKVIHIKSKHAIEHPVFEQLRSKINKRIKKNERLIFNSPSHLIFFLKDTPASKILAIVKKIVGEHESIQHSFPDEGKLLGYYF